MPFQSPLYMIASISISLVVLAAQSLAAAAPAITAAPENAAPHPWYVKALSDEVVNYCFFGGLCGMGGGMGGDSGGDSGYSIVGGVSTVSYQDYYTETYVTNTATTIYTTIPGSVITIYGAEGAQATNVADLTSVYTTCYPATTYTSVYPAAHTAKHAVANIARIESYAHAIANAVVAPPQMTKALASAYEAIMQHGYIHADRAVELVSQASEGFKALQTDPAYEQQRKNLAAHATYVDFNKAIAKATQSHSAGVARLLAEPSGKEAYNSVKNLGQQFIKEFLHQ